jgi:hypothetical protein
MDEVHALTDAVRECVRHGSEWGADYRYSSRTNEFSLVDGKDDGPTSNRSSA